MHIDQPFANHNGGAVVFGPDGMLYIAMGDGGSGGDPQGNGQRLDTLPRQDPAHRRRRRRGPGPGIRGPDRQPVRRDRRRPPGDLAHRDAQPVADALRPADRRPVDRRRRPGRMGGDRRRARRARRSRLRLEPDGGLHCYEPAEGCDQTGLTLPVTEYGHDAGCAVIGGVVVRDPTQAVARRAVPVRRRLLGERCGSSIRSATSLATRPSGSRAAADQLDRPGRQTAPST